MKDGFAELWDKLIVFLIAVAVYVWIFVIRLLTAIHESLTWFFCQLAAEIQLAKDDSGQFDDQQPHCKSGRHERYRS